MADKHFDNGSNNGGSGGGHMDDPANWAENAVPLSGETVDFFTSFAFGTIVDGTCAGDVVATSNNTISGGTFAGAFSHPTGEGTLTIAGGAFSGGAVALAGSQISGGTFSHPITSAGCTFTADPGAAIHGSASTAYHASMAVDITDDGSGDFGSGSYTFSGNVSYAGTFNQTNPQFTAGNFTAAAIAGGNFSAQTIFCTNIAGGTIVLSGGVTLHFGSGDGAGVAIILTNITGTIGAINWPDHNYSATVSLLGGLSYSVTVPAQDQVENAVPFGTSGNASGQLAASGGSRSRRYLGN